MIKFGASLVSNIFCHCGFDCFCGCCGVVALKFLVVNIEIFAFVRFVKNSFPNNRHLLITKKDLKI